MKNTIYISLGAEKNLYFEKNRSLDEKAVFSPKGQQIDEFYISIMCSGAQNGFKSNPLYQIW